MTEVQGAAPPLGGSSVVTQPAPLRYVQHVIIGAAIAVASLFTLFAWPFAILTGFVIGRSEVDRKQGVRRSAGATIAAFAAVTGGVLAMMVFGAILGGLISFIIVAFAALSERVAADSSATDRTIARILVVLVAALGWLAIVVVLGVKVDVRIGS